jgi:GTPase involved in cell partitioning and DNA repair
LERKGDTDAGDALSQGSPLDLSGATLRVSVPPGTFVKTAGGRALGDLVTPGQELLVASGGEGGPCIVGAARGRVAKRKAADASRGKNGEAEGERSRALPLVPSLRGCYGVVAGM